MDKKKCPLEDNLQAGFQNPIISSWEMSYDKEIRYIDGHFYRYIEIDDSLENECFYKGV